MGKGKGRREGNERTFLVMMKEVPIAIELETANANPMYLSPGETDEMISSEPLIANAVRRDHFQLSNRQASTERVHPYRFEREYETGVDERRRR